MSGQQHALITSLNVLESDLGHYHVGSSAIVQPGSKNLSDDALALYKVIEDVKRELCCETNSLGMTRIAGSDYRVESNRLTERVTILTKVGRFEMPYGTRIRIVGRF